MSLLVSAYDQDWVGHSFLIQVPSVESLTLSRKGQKFSLFLDYYEQGFKTEICFGEGWKTGKTKGPNQELRGVLLQG